MNSSKQYWALLRFQAAVSPVVWVFPLAFCTPLLLTSLAEPSLNLLMMTQNLFLLLLLGALILGPEIFATASASQTRWMGVEFILTRAVDRPVLARAKASLFYFIALVAPMAMVLLSLRRPDLHVAIYSRAAQLDCLSHIPGSALMDKGGRSNLVSIPSGHVLVETWRAWQFLVLAVLVQAFVYFIHPYRFRRYFLWAMFLVVSTAPLWTTLSRHGSDSLEEHLFFCFAANQAVFWLTAAGAMILGQYWCERRFAQLEQ